MSRGKLAAAGFAVSAVLVVVVPAWSASTPALDFQLTLTSQRPSQATALSLHTLYKDPSDPNAKPPPLRKSVVQAPAGTVFNGHAVPACQASDNELMSQGSSACPDGSLVGTGTVVVITGCGAPVDPATLDADLFNHGDGITELFTDHNTGVRLAVGHATFTAPNTLTETPSPNPGCPPSGETSVRQVDFHFKQVTGTTGKAFITSPPTCPASRTWVSTLTATLADGNTYTASSATLCLHPTAPPHHHHTKRRHHHRA